MWFFVRSFGAVTLLQSLQRVHRLEIGNLYSKELERLGFGCEYP